MSIFSKALEKGLKSSLSLCGEATVAEGGESSPSTARIRYRIAEHAAEFSFLLPGDGRSIAEFTCRLSRRRNAHSRRRFQSGLKG